MAQRFGNGWGMEYVRLLKHFPLRCVILSKRRTADPLILCPQQRGCLRVLTVGGG